MKKILVFLVLVLVLLPTQSALTKTDTIEKLLSEGAGKSNKVPKGLTTAPGIQKKLNKQTILAFWDFNEPEGTRLNDAHNEGLLENTWYGFDVPGNPNTIEGWVINGEGGLERDLLPGGLSFVSFDFEEVNTGTVALEIEVTWEETTPQFITNLQFENQPYGFVAWGVGKEGQAGPNPTIDNQAGVSNLSEMLFSYPTNRITMRNEIDFDQNLNYLYYDFHNGENGVLIKSLNISSVFKLDLDMRGENPGTIEYMKLLRG